MPAHTSRARVLALSTVWKFSQEFCTRRNFLRSFRAGLPTRAWYKSADESILNGLPDSACRGSRVGCKIRELRATRQPLQRAYSALFSKGFDLMLRPDGHDRQSDQDSNRDFEEAVKCNDPCSVRTRNKHDN